MRFPNPPHPDIREWDDRACDAAVVAQLLHMGGHLDVPFDTAAFDRRIKREPRSLPTTLDGLRLLTRTLRNVTIAAYDTLASETVLDRVQLRRVLRQQGYKDATIDRYFNSATFERATGRARDELRLREELGEQRYSRTVCSDGSKYLQRLFGLGALVVTQRNRSTAIDHPHSVLLVPQADKTIQLFDPAAGLVTTILSELLTDPLLRFDERGFTAYIMR